MDVELQIYIKVKLLCGCLCGRDDEGGFWRAFDLGVVCDGQVGECM